MDVRDRSDVSSGYGKRRTKEDRYYERILEDYRRRPFENRKGEPISVFAKDFDDIKIIKEMKTDSEDGLNRTRATIEEDVEEEPSKFADRTVRRGRRLTVG